MTYATGYVLLHSFAHALMRQLALECGYTAASVREGIYSRNPNKETRPTPANHGDHMPRRHTTPYKILPISEQWLNLTTESIERIQQESV
jgi:hypothetical protein